MRAGKIPVLVLLFVCTVFLLTTGCNLTRPCRDDFVGVGEGVITMTTSSLYVEIAIGPINNIVIDWGDGAKSTMSANPTWHNLIQFKHTYENDLPRTITIFGDITYLQSFDGNLTNLDISRNPLLEGLVIYAPITDLYLDNNTVLQFLLIYDNQLIDLDISNNTMLHSIFLRGTQLTNLDLRNNIMLESLSVFESSLTSLDVGYNVILESLRIGGLPLTNLELSKNTMLRSLTVSDTPLTNLNVANNVMLEALEINGFPLTNIDLSKNAVLQFLSIQDNQLTNLNLSNNKNLRLVNIRNNLFLPNALDDLFRTLHDIPVQKEIRIGNNPGTDECDIGIATAKGWSVGVW